MSNRSLAVIGLCLLALSLTKPPFFLFALLLLCVHPMARGSARRTRVALGSVIGGVLVSTIVWNRIGFPQGAVETYRPGIDQGGQVKWIVTHPLDYANVVTDTFLGWESQEFVVRGWVGAFGMFRTGNQDSPLMIQFLVVLAAMGLAWFTAAERGPRRPIDGWPAQLRSFVPLVLMALMVLALYTAAYVAWDAVGAARIYGIQGRYFLPVLSLPAATLALRRDPAPGYRAVSLLPVPLVLLVGALIKIETYFY